MPLPCKSVQKLCVQKCTYKTALEHFPDLFLNRQLWSRFFVLIFGVENYKKELGDEKYYVKNFRKKLTVIKDQFNPCLTTTAQFGEENEPENCIV